MRLHRHLSLVVLALAVTVAGCSDDDGAPVQPTATSVPQSATPTAPPEATATSTPIPEATATATHAPTASETATAPPTETATADATPTPTIDAAAAAAAGEEAFFDTLDGTANREEESIALLSAAVSGNPDDGRSLFLLGMMHLYRVGQNLPDYDNPSEFVLAEAALAQTALDQAVPLSVEDIRVPGFRGAATYLRGVVEKDEALRALGLMQLREAIELYPDFNNFSFLGAVAPIVSRNDPLFLEALELVRQAIASGCGPLTQPEICGNEGKAPHNIQGAMMMFGDMYAKAGDRNQALAYYNLGLGLLGGETWPFRSAMEERIAAVDDRVARWADEDPSNDPPFAGNGPESCAICHFK